MQKRLEACLVLGCNGFLGEDGFRACHGVENLIIDLSSIPDDNYENILRFLDEACDLFSRPMNDYNKCANTLSLLYKNYDGYNDLMLRNVQLFLRMHKRCGIWIMLVMKEDFDE